METIINLLLDKGLIPLAIIVAGWVAARYLAPYLAAHPKSKETARDIAAIADDISHVLVANNPQAVWDDHLAALIDKLKAVLDLGDDTAERVAKAALLRRKIEGIQIPEKIELRGTKIIDERDTDR